MMKKLTTLLLIFCCLIGYSQETEESFSKWNLKLGINVVDNRGAGDLFAGLGRLDQNAFSDLPLTFGLENRLSRKFGIEAIFTLNSWDSSTSVIDGFNLTGTEGYYALDVNGKLYVNELFNFSSDFDWLDMYANAGLGRFTINDGTFTLNYGGGASIWISENFALDFNAIIKNALSDDNLFETSHFVYSFGAIIKLSRNKNVEKEVVIEETIEVADTDSDGVPDDKDYCINSPGFPENNGCPYSDSDGDGVVDKADHCPTIKGDPANRGCPAPKKVVEVVEVVSQDLPKEDLLTVAKKIQFESGNYNFTQETYPYLIDLAKILINEPSSVRFKIVGHTDSSGSYEANRKLSVRRASAVRNYLVDSGIAKERIDIEGLGESDPIDTNLTVEGRANNRRVDIIILK